MKARVTYTNDNRIASIGLGEHLLADEDSSEVDLPDDFPSLTGPDAEREVFRAVARLTGKP